MVSNEYIKRDVLKRLAMKKRQGLMTVCCVFRARILPKRLKVITFQQNHKNF